MTADSGRRTDGFNQRWVVLLAAWWGLVLIAPSAIAQDIQVSATVNRQQVALGESLQLQLTVNGSQDAAAPNLEFDGFLVHYRGPSTQISIVNGRMSSSVTHSYSLVPQREGTFTIGPISLSIGGRSFATDPLTVSVVPSSAGSAQQAPSAQPGQPNVGDALQLELWANNTQPYQREAVQARLQLLIRDITVREISMPTLQADGFLVRPLEQPKESRVRVAGKIHTLLEFHTVIVPIRTGALSLGPATMECRIVVREPRSARRRRDPFDGLFSGFFGRARLVPVTVRAEPVMLEARPLPAAGQPPGFRGAVGRFSLEVTAIPHEVTAGEPVTLTMTVRGEGNFDTVTAPELVGDTGHFKVYDPKLLQDNGQGQDLTRKVFEQVLIPVDPDVRELPAVAFSYFDPVRQRYDTSTEAPITITVNPTTTPDRVTVIGDLDGAAGRAAAELLGRDIVYIKEELVRPRRGGRTWDGIGGWLLWLGSPLLLLLVSEVTRRRQVYLAADPAAARASGALKRTLARCRAARQMKQQGQVAAFYAEVFRAIQQYTGDRFNLPSEGMTKAELDRYLLPRGVPEEMMRDLYELFDRCDAARFAPDAADPDQMATVLQAAESILKRLDRWRAS